MKRHISRRSAIAALAASWSGCSSKPKCRLPDTPARPRVELWDSDESWRNNKDYQPDLEWTKLDADLYAPVKPAWRRWAIAALTVRTYCHIDPDDAESLLGQELNAPNEYTPYLIRGLLGGSVETAGTYLTFAGWKFSDTPDVSWERWPHVVFLPTDDLEAVFVVASVAS